MENVPIRTPSVSEVGCCLSHLEALDPTSLTLGVRMDSDHCLVETSFAHYDHQLNIACL